MIDEQQICTPIKTNRLTLGQPVEMQIQKTHEVTSQHSSLYQGDTGGQRVERNAATTNKVLFPPIRTKTTDSKNHY